MKNDKSKTTNKEEPEVVPLEEKDPFRRRLFSIVDHVNRVNVNAEKMALNMIESEFCTTEDLEFARRLIQKVRSHDTSKFAGIEFDYLDRDVDKDMFQLSLKQHQYTNDHHPEYWGGISKMPDLALAELCCDWASRSQEMGTDLKSYIKDVACKRFGFTPKTNVYKKLKKYVEFLVEPTF